VDLNRDVEKGNLREQTLDVWDVRDPSRDNNSRCSDMAVQEIYRGDLVRSTAAHGGEDSLEEEKKDNVPPVSGDTEPL